MNNGRFYIPVLEFDDRLFALSDIRDRKAREEHCMRILGQLTWPNGKMKPGTDEEKRAARQELQRLYNNVA